MISNEQVERLRNVASELCERAVEIIDAEITSMQLETPDAVYLCSLIAAQLASVAIIGNLSKEGVEHGFNSLVAVFIELFTQQAKLMREVKRLELESGERFDDNPEKFLNKITERVGETYYAQSRTNDDDNAEGENW